MLRTALLAAATLKYSATHAAPFECNIHDARISLYIAVRTSLQSTQIRLGMQDDR